MIQVEEFLTLSQDKSFVEGQFNQTSDLNILFINPELTGNGVYKMILPATVLKGTGVCATAITGITNFNPRKKFQNVDKTAIRPKHILWADTIVFPFINYPLAPLFDEIRAMNQNLKIVYHVDFNFLLLPKTHPYKEAFTHSVEHKYILKNIVSADTIVTSNNRLSSAMLEELERNNMPCERAKFQTMMLCIDEGFLTEGLAVNPIIERDYFSLVIIAKDDQLDDLLSCTPLVREAKKKYGKKLQVTIFGVSRTGRENPAFIEMTKGIEHIPERPVGITKYLQRLNAINPDAVLIPFATNEYNLSSADYKRFLECSLLKIPVITPRAFPLEVIIKHGDNGFMYDTPEQFVVIINDLFSNRQTGIDAGTAAYDFIKQNFTYNQIKLQKLVNILG